MQEHDLNNTPAEWNPQVTCPECGSTDTRFIEPHFEALVYECNACGVRFEVEEE